jgi:ABC-type sugar transport system permease subunit
LGRAPALLALPLVLYLGALLAYPTVHAVRMALTDSVTGAFPTFANLSLLAGDTLFWRALAGNLLLPVGTVAVELSVGLALALLFSARLPARRALRAIVIIPFALPEIVFLAIMRHILAPRGYLNAALAAVGVPGLDWLVPGRPLTYVAVVLVDAWHVTPVVFLMLVAALAAIPEEIGEAARLDGARGLARLRLVTLPLLRPALLAALLLRGVDALRVFATPLVLAGTEGAPVLSTYAYHQWSDYGNDGAAAAAAMLLAVLTAACCAPLLRRREAA